MNAHRSKNYTCMLCDAHCGLSVDLDGDRVTGIQGNDADPFSRGHVCPKASAIGDLMEDPDRVREPLRRQGKGFVPVSWSEALDEITDRLAGIRRTHGADAIATYLGNPTAHDHGAALASVLFRAALGGKNHFSAVSVDTLPRMVASHVLYGVATAVPVPDIDHTDLFVMLGANPIVSNGSGMVSPDVRRRIAAIQERGGRVIVLDPRRTETAKKADAFHFIRPGSDALVVLAMIEHLLRQGQAERSTVLQRFGAEGLDALRGAAAAFPAERIEHHTGVPAAALRRIADDLAATPRAVLFGRMGTCVQEHGTTTTLLLDVFNALADNLDHEGGARFGTPAVDLLRLGAYLPESQGLGGTHSRVDGLPGFHGELPVAALLPEIETPGDGQIRALLVHAGNPVTSCPNGNRLAGALEGLDLMVAIDLYVNETTRYADFILPTPFGFERTHYPLFFAMQGIRDFASFYRPLVQAPAGVKESWDLLLDLAARVNAHAGLFRRFIASLLRIIRRIGPERIIGILLRLGPHRLRLSDLEAEGTTTDLGPLQPRLAAILRWKHRRLHFFPELLANQIPDLEARIDRPLPALVLISRRTRRSVNSWIHNVPRLQGGRPRCTLEMHPDDAIRRGLEDGCFARVASDVGMIEVPVTVTDRMMPGVVCLPHGWGQDKDGVRLRVSRRQIGESVNDVIDHRRVDAISGASALSGQPVTVDRV